MGRYLAKPIINSESPSHAKKKTSSAFAKDVFILLLSAYSALHDLFSIMGIIFSRLW